MGEGTTENEGFPAQPGEAPRDSERDATEPVEVTETEDKGNQAEHRHKAADEASDPNVQAVVEGPVEQSPVTEPTDEDATRPKKRGRPRKL